MKTCIKCLTQKSEDEFSWKNKASGVRSNTCKSCHKDYAKKHYQENSTSYKERASLSRPKYVKQCRDYVISYLSSHPCVDCGETDIEVLEFDHREMVGKDGKRVVNFLGSINKLKSEIEKCDVRCSNCHTRRTRRQLGWLRVR